MRLPRKVKVNGIPFNVTKDRTTMGARFSYPNATITIGTKKLSDGEVLENFIHEIAEISMIERGMRSTRCKPDTESDEYIFCGDHRAFSDVITDVSTIIGDLMKI